MANQFRSYPKRRIERVQSTVSHSVVNSTSTKVLHASEDRKTLVRAIIQLHTVGSADGGNYQFLLHREPRGTSIGNPVVTESLDGDKCKEEIWTYTAYADNTGGNPANSNHIFVDLSAMRKLDPGDEIVLKTLGAGANTCEVVGTITLFFKE